MNVVNVKVCGMEYNLKGEEKIEYLHMLAGYVDKKVNLIAEKNPKLSISAATVLAAINISDEFFKWNNYIEELENRSAIFESSQKSMKETIDNLKNQVEELEKEKKQLIEAQSNLPDNEDGLKLKAQVELLQEELNGYKEKNKLLEKESNETSVKDEELQNLQQQYKVLEEEAKNYKEKNLKLVAINKETKFSLQSAKFKILELENKFIDSQVQLAVLKKKNSGNILLK